MAALDEQLAAESHRLHDRLRELSRRVVFAESCTAGLVASSLSKLPGISNYLCGSAVVYTLKAKEDWLGVPHDLLDDPGPVSAIVAEKMAVGVLQRTVQADFAASITGHLGPDAPPDLDGIAYVSVAKRDESGEPTICQTNRVALDEFTGGQGNESFDLRSLRHLVAARLVMETVRSRLA